MDESVSESMQKSPAVTSPVMSALWRYTTLPALGILAISVLFPPERMPAVEICHFRRLTGLDCPGCGLTRSFTCITHGRFEEAMAFHPFGFVFWGLTLLLLVYPLIPRLAPRLHGWLTRSRVISAAGIFLFVMMLVYGIGRLVL